MSTRKINNITKWNWLDAKVQYMQLVDRLKEHGIDNDEAVDILSVAYHNAIENDKMK